MKNKLEWFNLKVCTFLQPSNSLLDLLCYPFFSVKLYGFNISWKNFDMTVYVFFILKDFIFFSKIVF